MITCGIDLASQSAGTALAVLEWTSVGAKARVIEAGVDDEFILESAKESQFISMIAPFGWPEPFFQFLLDHRDGRVNEPRRVATTSGRDHIMYRTTERRVREWMGLKLMSATSNMLGTTTLRCAGLLTRFQDEGIEVSRGGGGQATEAYPSASLHAWGLYESAYKNKPEVRTTILEQITRRVNLSLGEWGNLCLENDDAFDALIAALTARSVAKGLWRAPLGDEEINAARTEGWICIPNGTIDLLR